MPRKHSLYDSGSERFDESWSFERIGQPSRRAQAIPPPPEPTRTESLLDALTPFFEQKWITDVLYTVKSGKEATVFCCRAHPDTELDLIAAKVYRSRDDRSFKNDAIYQEGRFIVDKRMRRAVEHKTRKGREVQFNLWVEHEFQTLRRIYGAGALVPVPFANTKNAILMEYLGGEHEPAPTLSRATLAPHEVRPLFEHVLRTVELLLACGRVHADLSAFNILYWHGRVTVIDFPQAVDPEVNTNAFDLLQRDVTNICDYWTRYGLNANPERITGELWARYLANELDVEEM